MTDVEYSPNGEFLVFSTTAAWGGMSSATGGNGCDVVARFEANSNSPTAVASWTAYTGGDSTWTVEVTDNVVYAGGHQSWQNNPIGANVANQGAVSRPGIAALNTLNGMAYSWNPTRTRGVGVQDMLATDQGLWVGSDTDRIGAYEYHARIALLPLAGGDTLPAMDNPTLPATVYSVASAGSQLTRRDFTGTTASAPAPVNLPTPSVSWGTTVGAFVHNGMLYTAASNGQVTKRTFDGVDDGTASPVNAADQLVTQTDWHNTDVPTMTSMFFYDGRMYFTRSGQSSLYSRGFEPESDVVGQQRYTTAAVSGISYSGIRGAFVANDTFYYSNTSGQLFRADWSGRSPVGGTSVQVSGPGVDGQNWASRSMFVYGGVVVPPDNQPPTAEATLSCVGLTCTFDAADSDDPDGTIESYEWDFGDPNQTGTGETTTHTNPTPGTRTVTLTVTDDDGDSDTFTGQVNPTIPANQAPTAAATISCNLLACTYDGTDSDDPDGTIESYVWDFGDGNTDSVSGATTSHTYDSAGPRVVTLTVTDDGAPDDFTVNISPTDQVSPLAFVGSASTIGNRVSHTVAIPGPVEAGDAMVLFFAANTSTPTYTGPAGWTQVGTVSGGGTEGRAYSKVATAADAAAGATVRVTSSGYAKSEIAIAAYRGTDATSPVAAAASGQDAGGAAHTSPAVTAPNGNNWLVTYWADESPGTSGWTAPAGQAVRITQSDTGSGHMSGLVVDSNSPVSGSTGGLVATANSASSRGVSFSLVLH